MLLMCLKASFHSAALRQSLLNLVMDPFDDVRAFAAALLTDLPVDEPSDKAVLPQTAHDHSQSLGDPPLDLTLRRANEMMRAAGRADYADGFGRLKMLEFSYTSRWREGSRKGAAIVWESLLSLELDIAQAERNLSAAVSSVPTHARTIALR